MIKTLKCQVKWSIKEWCITNLASFAFFYKSLRHKHANGIRPWDNILFLRPPLCRGNDKRKTLPCQSPWPPCKFKGLWPVNPRIMRKPLGTKREHLPPAHLSTYPQLTHTGHNNLLHAPLSVAQMMCNPSLNMTGKRLWYWDKDWGVEQWREIQCLNRPSMGFPIQAYGHMLWILQPYL